jgi:hypothetical protein
MDQLQRGLSIEKARPLRAFGFYSHYVTYSMVLARLASLIFGFWLSLRRRLGKRPDRRHISGVHSGVGHDADAAAWLA